MLSLTTQINALTSSKLSTNKDLKRKQERLTNESQLLSIIVALSNIKRNHLFKRLRSNLTLTFLKSFFFKN